MRICVPNDIKYNKIIPYCIVICLSVVHKKRNRDRVHLYSVDGNHHGFIDV